MNLTELEALAGTTQATRQDIGRRWMKQKLVNLTPDDKKRIQENVMKKLDQLKETQEMPEESEDVN
jgi:hypothetical protein